MPWDPWKIVILDISLIKHFHNLTNLFSPSFTLPVTLLIIQYTLCYTIPFFKLNELKKWCKRMHDVSKIRQSYNFDLNKVNKVTAIIIVGMQKLNFMINKAIIKTLKISSILYRNILTDLSKVKKTYTECGAHLSTF